MKIGFDVDGVLYPWHDIVYDYIVQELKVKCTYEEFCQAVINDAFSEIFMNNIVKNPILVTKRSIEPSIKKMLWDLSKQNEIFYVTARPKEVVLSTHKWFKDSAVPYLENVFIATDDNKVPFILEHDIDIFVEDRDKYIRALQEYTQIIVVKKLWNQHLWKEFPCINHVTELPEKLRVLAWI